MKLKIKVLEKVTGCMPVIIEKGDWIDLKSSETVELKAPQSSTLRHIRVNGVEKFYRDVTLSPYIIDLGVAMKLPKGFEAIVASRSSNPIKNNTMIANGIGIVDWEYNGEDDTWKMICIPLRDTIINKGDRICQFRIQLSQKSTIWNKFKWLFSSGVKIVPVKNLSKNNRGGIGSTGK